ncbi:MAG: hypothetical protein AB7O26_19530 [Planctomycetaceae bacterium]
MVNPAYDLYEDVLELLAPVDSISNHGPMAAEAICALGRPEATVRWTEEYIRRSPFLKARPSPTDRIHENNWQNALGKYGRFADWAYFFAIQMEEVPWQKLLDQWIARLAPGFAAIALHGPIRTCHAVRALTERDTPLRRKELANGLAHWAAGYQTMPAGTDGGKSDVLPSRRLPMLETLPPERRPAPTNLVQALKDLNDFPPFLESVGSNLSSISSEAFLSDLTETLAHSYAVNATDFLSVLGFVHAVTAPSGLRMIAPVLSPETLRSATGYAWQAAAGMYVRFGGNSSEREPPVEHLDVDELIDRAIAGSDEHAIKYTEACLREHALNPQPSYLVAAPMAVSFLSARR